MPIAHIHGNAKEPKLLAGLSKISYRMGIPFKCKRTNKKQLKNILKRTKAYQVKAAAERIKKNRRLLTFNRTTKKNSE
jgi:hypothetical protein